MHRRVRRKAGREHVGRRFARVSGLVRIVSKVIRERASTPRFLAQPGDAARHQGPLRVVGPGRAAFGSKPVADEVDRQRAHAFSVPTWRRARSRRRAPGRPSPSRAPRPPRRAGDRGRPRTPRAAAGTRRRAPRHVREIGREPASDEPARLPVRQRAARTRTCRSCRLPEGVLHALELPQRPAR